MNAAQQLKGPKGLPFLGSLPQFSRGALGFYQSLVRDFHPMTQFRIGPRTWYFVSDPELIETLLVGKHRDCVKDLVTGELRPLVGRGLLTNDGDSWRAQRKLAAPPFQPRNIGTYAQVMADCAQRCFASFKDGEQRDFHQDVMALTLEIVGKTLLGFDTQADASRVAHAMEEALPYFDDRLFTLQGFLPASLPTRNARRFRKAKKELDAVIADIIARARAAGADGEHLLARLIAARDEAGMPMDEQLLADEALTMLLAGHETTALTIMFLVYALATNEPVAQRVRAEVDEVCGAQSPTMEQLAQLPLLDASIKEVLRLYPPAAAMGREVAVPIVLGGVDLARGAQVVMSPYAMQRSERYFNDPSSFRPDRWLDGSTDALPKFAYFPFGGGPRVCIGQHFAMMEAKIVAAALIQQVRLEVPSTFQMKLHPVITLRSANGLPVIVKRRAASQPVG